MAEDDVTDLEQPVKKSRGKGKLLVVVILGLLIVGGGVGGTFYFLNRQKSDNKTAHAKAPPKESYYLPLDPAFVVNFQSGDSRARFLQVTLDAVTHDKAVLDEIKKHMPVIRNNLVMLFSSQTYKSLITSQGKEKLRAEALKEIQQVMEKETGKKGVDNVYFTSFVMQ